MEDLGPDPQALGEARGAGGDDHELLEVDRVVGVGAAVEDVHHRHRQDRRLAAAVELGEVAVERLAGVGGGGLGDRQRDAEDRVGAEPALVRGAVELDHRLVERALLGGAGALQRRGDLTVDVGDRAARRPCRAQASPPSRSSTASNSPVEAPEGTAASPRAPDSRATSTSTVGLPRESRIWRAWMDCDRAQDAVMPLGERW